MVFDLDYLPVLPNKKDYNIAIIGSGGIVNAAHLPAYRKAGFSVVGLTDKDPEKARETAQKFEIPRVYLTVEELLNDPAVDIVDIAVPPWNQKRIVRQVTTAGKHLLCQKPLSNILSEAVEIVEMAEAKGVKLAVNQQMRWDQAIRASHTLLNKGLLGEVASASIDVSIQTDWSNWPWALTVEGLDLMYHSIHYFDSMRYLFGQPNRIWSTGARYPGQDAVGETRTISVLNYSDSFLGNVSVNHNNWTDNCFATLRIDGTEGYVSGTFGLLYDYPHGRPDTLSYMSQNIDPNKTIHHRFKERWIPDSFIGPMGDLMSAIEEDRIPETSGRDNLMPLPLVHAAYLSMSENRAVLPKDISLNS